MEISTHHCLKPHGFMLSNLCGLFLVQVRRLQLRFKLPKLHAEKHAKKTFNTECGKV